MHFNGRSAACTQQHTLIRSGNCEFLWGPVYHRKLHPNVRARHVDILRKRLPPSNLYCLSKDDELEMDNTIKRMKRGKKRGKRLKKNKSISISRKRSLCRRLLSNRKYYRIQNITNNKKKVAWKRKPLEKKIRKKEDNNIDNKEKKKKKQQKQNANSAGRSSSAPKPVWE